MKKKSLAVAAVLSFVMLAGCDSGPKPIRLGQDSCDFCKMAISDKSFGAEIVTKKGKVFKFDDTHCLTGYRAEKMNADDIKDVYLVNYAEPHNFIKAENAILVHSEDIHSPMGGNVAAFEKEEDAKETESKVSGKRITLNDLYNSQE